MASTPIATYAFEELTDGSGRGAFGNDGRGEATRVFKIAWTDLNNFLFALKGGWRAINTNTWTYYEPNAHPNFPSLYCTDAEFEALGLPSQNATTKVSSWEYAKVTAKYSTSRIDHGASDPTALKEEEYDFGTQTVKLPRGSMKWNGTSDIIDEEICIQVPLLTYIVRLPALPKLPGGSIATVMALIGKINNASFGGGATGKIKFEGMRATRRGSSILTTDPVVGSSALDSSLRWDVVMKFVYFEPGWNYLFRPDTGTFVEIISVNGSRKPYESGNLNPLLPNGT